MLKYGSCVTRGTAGGRKGASFAWTGVETTTAPRLAIMVATMGRSPDAIMAGSIAEDKQTHRRQRKDRRARSNGPSQSTVQCRNTIEIVRADEKADRLRPLIGAGRTARNVHPWATRSVVFLHQLRDPLQVELALRSPALFAAGDVGAEVFVQTIGFLGQFPG